MSLVVNQNIAEDKEARTANIIYTQAGVSCFVGQESGKFKVQFFVGSLVVKSPAFAKRQNVGGHYEIAQT